MSRQLRPRGKTPTLNPHQNHRYEPKQIQDQHNKFKLRVQNIKSAKERITHSKQPSGGIDSELKSQMHSSKSKFLERFNSIRSCRQSTVEKGRDTEEKLREEFENNKKQLFIQTKFNNLSFENSVFTSVEFLPQTVPLKKRNRNCVHTPPTDHLRTRPQSAVIQFVELNKISIQQLVLRKGDNSVKPSIEDNYEVGFWKIHNCFVSLIPLEKNQKVSFQHPNILPIYAQVTLNEKRFVISDQYKNCSLKNLLEQFGPFEQSLGKRYLKQIALGLQHMHYHRRGHNRINLKAILYNKNGELFINAVRSTSFVPSKDQLQHNKDIHYFAPEFLLSKGFSKSLKNDVWALGCLAILMLTSTGLTRSPLHPYNFTKIENSSEERMIDNMTQIHRGYFSEPIVDEKLYKSVNEMRSSLSVSALNFISSCLRILSDERPSIESLLQHQFFEGI